MLTGPPVPRWLAGSRFEAFVADRMSLWVHAFWRDHPDDAVGGQSEVPFTLMDQVVMEGADQASVGQIGRPAMTPRLDVMCFAPGGCA